MRQQVENADRGMPGGGRIFHGRENRRGDFSRGWKKTVLLLWWVPLATWGHVEYSQTEPEPEAPAAARVSDEQDILRQQLMETQASQRKELSRAMEAYRQGSLPEAIAQLEQLIEDDPTLLTAWSVLGSAYLKAERGDEAIRLWEKLRAVRPDFFPVHNWLGRAYMLRNEYGQAIEAYRTSLKVQPRQEQEGTSLNFARVLRWGGHLEEAITLLRPLHQANPERLDLTRELASALISNREYEEALPLWTALRTAEPTRPLFRAKEAVALLHTGHAEEAVAQAHAVLAEDPQQPDALLLMANYAQFHGGRPEEALPWLDRLIAQAGTFNLRRRYTLRHTFLYFKLNAVHPELYPLGILMAMLDQAVQTDPYDLDVGMAYVELLRADNRFADARAQIDRILTDLNPNSTRAHNNLFEIAIEQALFKEAEEHLRRQGAFNPDDPYLHHARARWYGAQGLYSEAQREIDQLEAAGRRGAVAVLLYHGLTTSESDEVLPVSKLREHLQTLKQAGFRFISANELPEYFSNLARKQEAFGPTGMERVVCVTFDDARRDSMRYGTPVGKELDIPFSMHIPVGFVERNHPFMCTWEQLREYQQEGCWRFGGHTFDAHDRMPVDAENRIGFPLPNHLWLAQEKRFETDAEYDARLTREYTGCHDLIVQNLGRTNECNFFAYPFGDIGQITRSNDREAVAKNLEHVARSYAVGFIQSDFGYAVAGDNPLLYQRYEPDRTHTGEEVLAHVLKNHPVNLARKQRAGFAALADKRHLMLSSLHALRQDGYPAELLEKLRMELETKLGRSIPRSEIETKRPETEAPP